MGGFEGVPVSTAVDSTFGGVKSFRAIMSEFRATSLQTERKIEVYRDLYCYYLGKCILHHVVLNENAFQATMAQHEANIHQLRNMQLGVGFWEAMSNAQTNYFGVFQQREATWKAILMGIPMSPDLHASLKLRLDNFEMELRAAENQAQQ